MSETTKIEWADRTFNPWDGCTKVSPGCENCYAEARNKRFHGGENWGKGKPRKKMSVANWRKPVKWNREAGTERRMCRIFPSICDWLDDEVRIEWLADFLNLIHDTPNLDWLLLTKRPENFKTRLHQVNLSQPAVGFDEALVDMVSGWIDGFAPPNVSLGVSVEDQPRADERIPALLRIPAAVMFLSVEPLIGPVDLAYTCFNGADSFGTMPGIHWVIVGGESGPGARPCNVEWIRDIVRQCKAAGVPCFVKQLGSVAVEDDPQMTAKGWDRNSVVRLNFKHPKGGDPAEWPEDLRVREFPGCAGIGKCSPLTPALSPLRGEGVR